MMQLYVLCFVLADDKMVNCAFLRNERPSVLCRLATSFCRWTTLAN